MEYSIGLLEHPPKTLTVLVYLRQQGTSNKTEIIEDLGIARQTLYSAVDRLKELDLVFEEKKKGFPQKSYVGLTVQGVELAESLVNVEGIVRETIKGYEMKLEALRSDEESADASNKQAEVLCKLGELSFARGRWDRAMTLATECEILAGMIGDSHAEARSNWILGEIMRRRGEIRLAVDHFKRSSELYTQLEDKGNLAEVHYSLGAVSERKGDFGEAIEEYQRSQELAEGAGFEISHSKALIGIGRIHGRKGEYEKSQEVLKRAIKLLKTSGAEEDLALAYGNLGATTTHLNSEKAIKWHEESIKAAKISGNSRLMATGQMNIAACLTKSSEYKLALENLEQAREILVELDDKKLLSSLWIQFGIVHRDQTKWTESRKYLLKAIDTAKRWELPYNEANALFNLGLLELARSNPDRAKNKLERALKLFEEMGNESKANDIRDTLEGISQ
ncbi:MAG: tetratricopeptide repeat protein [Candidatus Thorarchaeota archaeon]|jgi:tetratricopeptide (TPR) repeat protein